MMTLNDYLSSYPQLTSVVAVSKTQSLDAIEALHALGFNDFGENKVQELKAKATVHPEYHWHFIGHIQSNKIKDIASYAHTVHSIESNAQVEQFEKVCLKLNKNIDVLLQVNLANEAQKSGCTEAEIQQLCVAVKSTQHLKLKGLMVMGPSTLNPVETQAVFKQALALSHQTQKIHPECCELSMGMSQDYELALNYGSTILRLGSLLFGQRSV